MRSVVLGAQAYFLDVEGEAEAIEAGVLGADDACLDDASTTGLYAFGCSQISTPAWCSMLDDADFTAS